MRRAWRAMAAVALVLAAASMLLSVLLYERQSRESTRTTHALCTLRGDLETRVQSSRDFLLEHPNGVAGISAKVIADGVRNQQRTIDALSGLSCRE